MKSQFSQDTGQGMKSDLNLGFILYDMTEIKLDLHCPRCQKDMIFISRKGMPDSKSKKQCVFCGMKILVKDNARIPYRESDKNF